jgi:integrase
MAKARRGRNEGSIFYSEKRKRWTTFITVCGKRYYGHAQTKDAAKEKLLNLQSKANHGLLGREEGMPGSQKTVEQAVRDYLEYGVATGDIRESTAARYEGIISGKIVPAFGSLPVCELSRQHVKNLYVQEYEKGNSPASVLKLHNLISAALKDAVANKHCAENVTSKLRPTVEVEEAQPFTRDETNKLLDYAKRNGHRDSNLLCVAFRTGLRSGELLGLRWTDVDLSTGRLNVAQTLVNFGKRPKFGKPKNGKTRTINLANDAIAALRNQQVRLLAEGHPRPLVFPNTKGQPGNRNHLRERFQALCKEAGVPVLKFHATRHTFASLAIEAGVDYKTIQKILGHYSVALTIDTYGHLAPDAQRNAVQKMDLLFAASGG